MPQHTHFHFLLLWTAILSIVQFVFIIYFFTAGHHGLSQNSSAVAPEHTLQSQSPSQRGPRDKGKMLTFQAYEDNPSVNATDNRRIKWIAKNPDKSLVSEGKVLTFQKDGYYFLNLKVTSCLCNEEPTVILKRNSELLLEGRIKKELCSTGLLGKVAEMSARGTLEVTIDPNACINTSESKTYLSIIYMPL